MPPAYSGCEYWIGIFKTQVSGMLNQIDQLPAGVRRRAIERNLRACADALESLEKDPRPDEEFNLLLFSGHSPNTDEEYAAHV